MMDIITRTISGDGKSTEVGKLLADGYTILTSATSQYDGRIYITLVMGKAPALEAAREPAPAPTPAQGYRLKLFLFDGVYYAEVDGFSGVSGTGKTEAEALEQLRGRLNALERHEVRELERVRAARAACEPAPTPETDTVTISRDEHEAARATVSELMNTIREIAIYADGERYNANASAYLTLTKVVELAEVTRRKYGDILPE